MMSERERVCVRGGVHRLLFLVDIRQKAGGAICMDTRCQTDLQAMSTYGRGASKGKTPICGREEKWGGHGH